MAFVLVSDDFRTCAGALLQPPTTITAMSVAIHFFMLSVDLHSCFLLLHRQLSHRTQKVNRRLVTALRKSSRPADGKIPAARAACVIRLHPNG